MRWPAESFVLLLAACSPAAPSNGPVAPPAPTTGETAVPPAADASASASAASPASAAPAAAPPPTLAPWESMADPCMFGFQEGPQSQRAERGGDTRAWVPPTGLTATMPTANFVTSVADKAVVGYASASFDCGYTAVKVTTVGSLYPGDIDSARRKADLYGATKITDTKLADGFVVLATGKQQSAEHMVFSVRKIGGREIYCEGTSRTAAGRDAMRAIVRLAADRRLGEHLGRVDRRA
jgi:hypothetical protein